MSLTSLMPFWSIESCVIAETLTATFDSDSSWRVAVTTTSCSELVWAEADWASAAP